MVLAAIILLLIFYLLCLARRKIGRAPKKELASFMYDRLVVCGITSSPPKVFLTLDTVMCNITTGDPWFSCSAYLLLQLSIGLMLFVILVARLVFEPVLIIVVYTYK